MFKTYQFKWYFILAGILTISSLLLRQESFREVKWWEFLDYALHLFLMLLICWLIHGYFLLRKFSISNYANHFVSNILATISVFTISLISYNLLPHTSLAESVSYNTIPNLITHISGAFLLSIICYVVFYSIHTNAALQTSKLENELLEQAHLRAQLLSLQQQISPHFLFNSLSTLKTITNEKDTKNYVVQLATVYRYLLNFNEHYLTELKDELTFINSYLYIMTQRFEEALKVTIDIPNSHLGLMIPPLSLQLLIENAIKHNRISPEQPLHISITTNDAPALIVNNDLRPKTKTEEGTGTGLKNIKERYKLLANQTVTISKDDNKFSVTLPLIQK
jgi:two-component system LytT family sensor kinase